jgi:proline iminopeptidase
MDPRTELTARNFPTAEQEALAPPAPSRYEGPGSSYKLAFTDTEFLLREELRPSLVDTLKAFEDKGLYTDPLYLGLVEKEFYAKHICRIYPFPEPVARSFKHFNMEVYAYMQGPSEFVPGGILKDWTVWDRLKELRVPTLTVGARYDSMNPEEMKEMAALVQNGQYHYCPNGSHMALWDDQQVYMNGVVGFIQGVGKRK